MTEPAQRAGGTPEPAIAPPLTLASLPPAIVEPIANAQLLPVQPGKGFSNGVFRPDGSFCELSRTRMSDSRFTDRADTLAEISSNKLGGNHLFCGLGRHHFGHFLMETASRLWALDGRIDHIDGLIILPVPNIDFSAVLKRRLKLFLDLMGCTMPIHLVERPLTVERLYVPAQGFGHLQWAVGTDAFRRFVRDRIDQTCPPRGPDRIYVSRSKLKHAYQHIDQEARIEKLMEAAGYTIFHPEEHNVKVQCQTYRAAHTIVGGDGSAFHLAPFAMQPETRVGLIQRRARTAPVDAIAKQIEAFTSVDLVRLNPLRRAEDGTPAPSVGRKEAQPISIRALKRQLEKAHLI